MSLTEQEVMQELTANVGQTIVVKDIVVIHFDTDYVCMAANRPFAARVFEGGAELNGVRCTGVPNEARLFHDARICDVFCTHYVPTIGALDAMGVHDCYVCVGEQGSVVLAEQVPGEGWRDRAVRRRLYRRFVRAQQVGGEHPRAVLEDAVQYGCVPVGIEVCAVVAARVAGYLCDVFECADLGVLRTLGREDEAKYASELSAVKRASLLAARAAREDDFDAMRVYIDGAFAIARREVFMPCSWWYDVRVAASLKRRDWLVRESGKGLY